jgi:TonB family protein
MRNRLIATLAPALLLAQAVATRQPRLLEHAEPEYSEEARRAAVNTVVRLSMVVGEDGVPRDVKIDRGAGFGLDEQAARAVQSWRFEPGTKGGQPFAAPTHVDVSFNLMDQARQGQIARLNFNLPPGGEGPQLVKGKVPANPDQPGSASLRLSFTVGSDGRPKSFQTLDTNNQPWTDRALREMAGWRFRPAMRDGHPEQVDGVFELVVRKK